MLSLLSQSLPSALPLPRRISCSDETVVVISFVSNNGKTQEHAAPATGCELWFFPSFYVASASVADVGTKGPGYFSCTIAKLKMKEVKAQ